MDGESEEILREENIKLKKMLIALHKRLEDKDL
jgi:hypothetical protein